MQRGEDAKLVTESEAIERHSGGNNNLVPKNLVTSNY